jgi:hypothetical protein
VTFCSVARLHTIAEFGNTTNPTYDYQFLAIWSLVEIDMGVICACMPGMAGLLKRIWPRILGSTARSGHSYPQDSSKGSNTFGSSVRGKRGFARMSSPVKDISKTTSVTVSFAEANGAAQYDSKSMELELVDRNQQAPAFVQGRDPEPGYYQQQRSQSEQRYPPHQLPRGYFEPGSEVRDYRSNW